MTTFSLYWSDWICSWAVARGHEGRVMDRVWGGWNQGTRPVSKARPGDRIVITAGHKGLIYILGDLIVSEVSATTKWFARHPKEKSASPHSCAATVVVGEGTAPFGFDRIVPPQWLSDWTFINANKKPRQVQYLENGRLTKTSSFQGCFRLADETAARVHGLLDASLSPVTESLLSSDPALRGLERKLVAEPDHRETAHVYADALLDAGDPRGEATRLDLEHADADDKRKKQLVRKRNALVKKDGDVLIGRPGGFPFRLAWGPHKKVRV